jgi:hypothetical protein
MAKKAKKAKKASKSKKAAASGSAGKKSIMVPLHSVMHFAQMIEAEGHTDAFVKAAKKSKVFMAMDPSSVNFVKKFLTGNQLHAAMAVHVVDPCPNDPFECHFRN